MTRRLIIPSFSREQDNKVVQIREEREESRKRSDHPESKVNCRN
jgi:hypothetical protein